MQNVKNMNKKPRLKENNNGSINDITKIYFEIIGELEKLRWNNSKNKFEFGCSEDLLKEYAKKLNIDLESLILNLNEFLASSNKKIIPFLDKNEIRYFIFLKSKTGGLELDNFTSGIFGLIVGLIELSNGKIGKEEIISIFSKNKRLKNRIYQIKKAILFLISIDFLNYNAKEQCYELGIIGKVIMSKKVRNELEGFLKDNLYK